MTAVDISAIRAWLANQATSAAGVTRAVPYQPTSVNFRDLPLVSIGNPTSITYQRVFGFGSATVIIPITVLVAEGLPAETSTSACDAFMTQTLATTGTSASLVAIVRNEQTTAAVPWTSRVTSDGAGYALFQVESSTYAGVQFAVEVKT